MFFLCIILVSILVFAAVLLVYMRFEAGFVQVQKIMFSKSRNSFRILHISDIHIRHLKVPPKKVRDAISKEKPDIIIVTGDCVDKPRDVPAFIEFLESIKCGIPMYFCPGNHDYTAFKGNSKAMRNFLARIEKAGVVVLINKAICYEKNSKKYNIVGIDDLRKGRPNLEKALKSCHPGAYANIAFTHNPDVVFLMPPNKIDYLLCGHFHGGQIWLPFNLEFRILRHDRLCRMGMRKGLHKIRGINVYINRGLGNVVFPLRLFSRPEITVYYLP